MDGQGFANITKNIFSPFLRELGFEMESPLISGRFYRTNFRSAEKVISISFEPGDNAVFVVVFTLESGKLSDYDDRSRTPRLSDLNDRYMHLVSKLERVENESYFNTINVSGTAESLLLKYARELRLVLPKYLTSPCC